MDLLQFILCLFMIINAVYNVYQGAPAVQEDKQSKDEKLSQGSSEVNDAQEGCETLPLELIPRREQVASSNPCSTSHQDTHDRKQARGTSVKAGTRHRHTKPSPPEPHNPIVPLHKDIESHRPQGTARRLYASDPPPSYSFFVEPKPLVKPPIKPPKVKPPSYRNRVPQPPYPPHPMIIGRPNRPLQSSTNPRPAPPASDPKPSAPIPHTYMTMPPIPLPKSSDARNTLKQTSLDNHLGRQQQVADTVQHATPQSHPETKPQAPSDTEEKKHEQDKNVNLKDTTTTTAPFQKTLVNGSRGPLDRRNGTTPQSQPQPQPKAQLNVEGTGQVKHENIDKRQMLSSSTGPPDIRNERTPQPQLKAHLNVEGTGQAKHENIGIRQIPAQETSVDDRKTQPLPQPNVEETKQEPKYHTVTNSLPVIAVQPKPHSVPEPQQPQPQPPCPPTVHPLNGCTVERLPLSYYADYPMEDAETSVASNTSHQHEPQHIPMDVWVDEVIAPVAVVSFEMSIFSAEEKVTPASAPSYTYANCRWAWYTLRDVDEEMPYAHAGAEDTQLPVLPEATPMEIDPWSISSILPHHDHCNASNTPPASREPAPKSAFAPIDISSNGLDTTQPRYVPWTPPLVTGSSPGFVPTKPFFGRASFRGPSPPRLPQVLDVAHRLEVSQHAPEVSQLDVPQATTDVPDSTSESLPHKPEHPQHSPELSQLEVPQPEVVDESHKESHKLDHVQEPIFQPILEVSQLEVSQQPTDVPQELDAHHHGSWRHTLEPVPQPASEVLQQIVGVPDWNLDILPAQAPEIPQDVLDVPQVQAQDAPQPAPDAQYYALQSEPQQSAVGVQYAEIDNSVPATVPTKTTGLSLLDLCEAAKRAAAKDVKAKIKKEMDVLKELDVTHKCINIICVTAAKDSIDLIKSAQEKFCEDYHDHSLVSLDFDQISRISVWVRKIDLYEKTAHLAENTQHPPSTNLTTAPEASTSLESDHAFHPTSVASNSDGGRPHYPASTSFEAGPSTSTSPESPPQRYTAAQKGKGKAIPTDDQDTTNYWASPRACDDRTIDKSPLTTFSKLERFKDLKNPEVLTVWGTRKKQSSPKSRLESEQVVNDFMFESIAQNDHSRGEEYWKALDEKTGFTDASFDSEVTCGGPQEFQPADYCDVQHESSLSYVRPTSPNENIPRTIKPLPRRRLTSAPQHANSTDTVNDDRSPQVINPLPAWVRQSAAAAPPTMVEFVNYGPETDFDSL